MDETRGFRISDKKSKTRGANILMHINLKSLFFKIITKCFILLSMTASTLRSE